jgi:hypothetical protein
MTNLQYFLSFAKPDEAGHFPHRRLIEAIDAINHETDAYDFMDGYINFMITRHGYDAQDAARVAVGNMGYWITSINNPHKKQVWSKVTRHPLELL